MKPPILEASHRGIPRFYFVLGAKNRPESFREYILPPPKLQKKSNSALPQGEVILETRDNAIEKLFRLKVAQLLKEGSKNVKTLPERRKGFHYCF